MKNIFSTLQYIPKRTVAVIMMIAAAIVIPATLLAWGPNRPTYTMETPADHVTFDSITNNPNYGDERNFVTIKSTADTSAGGWTDDLSVQNGQEYYVRMYVHNNAAANLNLVAQNVTARFNLPTSTAKRIQVDGYLSSTNASPTEVWDQAVFNSTNDFNLSFVYGSASYTNNVFPGGISLSNNIVSAGDKLGYTQLDGNIPGCLQYSGYVTFKVKANVADFSIQKTVRVNGSADTTFRDSVTANPGSKVDYQIYFKNTGNTQLTNVVIKDTLPTATTYVTGSTYLYNSSGNRLVADGITSGGINIGGYSPSGDAYIKFTAQIAANDNLPVCGLDALINVAQATTYSGSKQDVATVNVLRQCTPTVPPVTPPVITTPTALPHTGASDNILAFLGLGSMTTGAGYYLASRRAASFLIRK